MPVSNTIANVYRAVLTLSAIGPHSFFLPAARPQCHLPCQRGLCHQPAWTPECQERQQQEAPNQGHSSVGTKLLLHQMPEQNGYSVWTLWMQLQSQSPYRRNRKKTNTRYAVLGKSMQRVYICSRTRTQGLLPPPRQCEGTRPSVYRLCS